MVSDVSTTPAAMHNGASARSPNTVSPKTRIDALASSGVMKGWSTYPHWVGSIRKYSSSRW